MKFQIGLAQTFWGGQILGCYNLGVADLNLSLTWVLFTLDTLQRLNLSQISKGGACLVGATEHKYDLYAQHSLNVLQK